MVKTYKIEKNVKVPALKRRGGRPPKYLFPFKSMEIGDSFVVDNKNEYQNARKAAISLGMKIEMRKEGEEHATKIPRRIRIWRIE
jgi:hypothetical protein